MTSLFTLPSVLEVSCAIWGMSWEQRRKACEGSGLQGWLISGQAGSPILLSVSGRVMVNKIRITNLSRSTKLSWETSQVFFAQLPLTGRRLREKALPGAAIRSPNLVVGRELSRWQDWYGAVFAPSRAADFCVGLP